MEQFSPLSQAPFPIEIIQGETFILPVTYIDDQGSVIDLTNYSAKMQIRTTPESTGTPIIELSTVNGLIVITGSTGHIQCTIPAATTAGLAGNTFGVYDLFITSLAGVSERILFGDVKITDRVTR